LIDNTSKARIGPNMQRWTRNMRPRFKSLYLQ